MVSDIKGRCCDHLVTATMTENKKDERSAKSIRIYDSENGQRLVPFVIPFMVARMAVSLAWTLDSHQLFAATYSQVKQFDMSSGSLLKEWLIPGGLWLGSVVLSCTKICCHSRMQITIFLGHIYIPASRHCYQAHKLCLVDCPLAK